MSDYIDALYVAYGKARAQGFDFDKSCLSCGRFQEVGHKCSAFGGQPPVEIVAGLVKHDKPIPGDNGLQFIPLKPEAEMTDEEYRWALDSADKKLNLLEQAKKNDCFWCGHYNQETRHCAKLGHKAPVDAAIGLKACPISSYPKGIGLESL